MKKKIKGIENMKVVGYCRVGTEKQLDNFKERGIFAMKKVILYCRVASSDQTNKKLDIQEHDLKNFAKSHNYEVIEVIKETGSGANLDRPGINKIFKMANLHKIDMVIAKNISRYGRCAASELNSFIEKLTAKGVEVIALAEGDLQKIIPLLKSMV